MPLNVEHLKQHLNPEGLRVAARVLASVTIIKKIDESWTNPKILKLGWKELRQLDNPSKQQSFSSTAESKEASVNKHSAGYYSVIFLEDNHEHRTPFLIGEGFAKGGKSILKNAYNLQTAEHVALKVVRGVTDEIEEEFKNEEQGLRFKDRYRGKLERQRKRYLAQEFILGMDGEAIKNKFNDEMNSSATKNFWDYYKSILQVIGLSLSELNQLHQAGFIHRDIGSSGISMGAALTSRNKIVLPCDNSQNCENPAQLI